jgi:hypothetical protein
VVSEIVTAAQLNTHVRDNLNSVSRVAYKSTAQIQVVSTSAQTSVLNQVIAGNTMGANGSLITAVNGHYINNTGGNQNFTIRVSFGGTTLWGHTYSLSPLAQWGPLPITFTIANQGSESIQIMHGFCHPPVAVAAFVAGSVAGTTGDRVPVVSFSPNGTINVNTAVSQTLEVTVQHGSSNANLSYLSGWEIVLHAAP